MAGIDDQRLAYLGQYVIGDWIEYNMYEGKLEYKGGVMLDKDFNIRLLNFGKNSNEYSIDGLKKDLYEFNDLISSAVLAQKPSRPYPNYHSYDLRAFEDLYDCIEKDHAGSDNLNDLIEYGSKQLRHKFLVDFTDWIQVVKNYPNISLNDCSE
ncbi:hypothetical protein HAX54_005621 [Datura stramonium]|uniref:Uncharacterized protein n=1 Tax=Datura stramonium TaxID=4076 RepID=A0ABS8T9T8_DATST|nr:hypothetical protein [Datura stramonium]